MSYYKSDYPHLSEVVYVTIVGFSDDNVIYCKLIEYNNKEGFLPDTELGKKVSKNPKNYFNENTIYPMAVIDVDEKMDRIAVSYSRVKECDRAPYMEKFGYFSKIHRLTSEIAILSNMLLDDILPFTMHRILQKQDIDNSKEIYDTILDNPVAYIGDIGTIDVVKVLGNIESRIVRTKMTIHQEFDLIVACDNAMRVIKEILRCDDVGVVIEYVNAPKYRIVVMGKLEQECDAKLENCVMRLREEAAAKGNKVVFKLGNKVVAKEKEMFIKPLPKRVS